jgi:hypothetical protein
VTRHTDTRAGGDRADRCGREAQPEPRLLTGGVGDEARAVVVELDAERGTEPAGTESQVGEATTSPARSRTPDAYSSGPHTMLTQRWMPYDKYT